MEQLVKQIKDTTRVNELSEYTLLWRRVLIQAMRDYNNTKKGKEEVEAREEARKFIDLRNRNFIDICTLADVSPSKVKRYVEING